VAWRGLHVSRPATLRLRQRSLEVEQEDGTLRFPLEDLAWIVLDTPQVTTTAALLAACMADGVPVVVSDERHMPCGVLLSFHQHHRQAGLARLQIAAAGPFCKRVWQAIVQQKIVNQAAALEPLDPISARTLSAIARQTRSGDPDNVEARAARFYWSHLFIGFRRGDNDRRNAMLNYGYAVLRAAVSRSLVAYGFLPAIGVHHDSAQNAFNLADDLIEPFRPFADRLAVNRWEQVRHDGGMELTLADRQVMAAVLTMDALLDEETVPMLASIDLAVESLQRAFAMGDAGELRTPTLPPPHDAQ
jgi:CRISP-associated protein Cas1